MSRILPKKIIEAAVLAASLFVYSAVAVAAADSLKVGNAEVHKEAKTAFIDRIAVKTNAFDWMLTIPNIGFEFDLTGSEFNSMTLGLSAKYNWNTSHKYSPPLLFNLTDVRPEFRYYYRTRTPVRGDNTGWTLEKFLKNRKNPKYWRASYVGAYVNYGTYAFKFGKKGMQGDAVGIGASAGYSIPMYEYKSGVVDVELGFSVGFQACTRDMFIHNPNGYFYTKVEEGSKGIHVTPYPVVSDVRVAFVWRHKSIKDKVKEDAVRNRLELQFNRIEGDYNYNDCSKSKYDTTLENTMTSSERRKVMESDSLYLSGFIRLLDEQEMTLRSYLPNAFPAEDDPHAQSIIEEFQQNLEKRIVQRKKEAMKLFEKDWSAAKSEAAKKAKAAQTEKPAKSQQEAKPEKVEKTEKPEKEKKPEKQAKDKKEKKTKTKDDE